MATNLEGQLADGLKTALKAKDTRTANLIRMIKTKIMERRTASVGEGMAQPVVDDALVLEVITAYKKSMEKARVEYAAAGDRGKDQLEELEFEIGWCKQWLPEQLSEAELRDAVAKAVAELPKKDPKMAGRVIGAIKKQFGDRADAQLVKKLAEELLAAP
ncbi:MAG: GatB/YqeY domain-containing protein [Deltaproteobacteria bacterium]|nr:GatB/YqeY domain-containing protein [Deltaproteobacteria bacterium]MCW5806854.1 GatB/YqeY domain-containing protein [Deltaproteobacteria bacterium]